MNVSGGSVDVTTYFALRLTATGLEATGLTITDFDLQYVRTGEVPTAKVDAVALAATNTAHTDNRAIEIDATDQPGLYRVDWPDAAFTAGAREVILSVKCATCFTEHLRVSIDAPVDVRKLQGDEQSLIDLKDFADAGYDPATNKVQGVVLTDAVTTVNGLAANVITAASIAGDAITDAKVAADVTIASVTGAVGSVAGSVGSVAGNIAGNVTGSVGSIATGGIASTSFAAGAITETSIAADAITAAKVADGTIDAATFAAGAINAAAIAGDAITDAKVASDVTIASVTGSVGSVTGNVGGNVTGTIGGLTAAALKDFFDTDSTTTYASAVAGSVVKEMADNAGGASLTLSDIADAVWDEILSGHAIPGSAGVALSAAGTAGDPWITALPGAYGAGSAGFIVGNNLNASVGSRATQTSLDTLDDFVDTEVAAIKAKTDNLPSDPADASDIASAFATVNSTLGTIAGFIDTEVALILTRLGTPAGASMSADIADLPTNAELATALGTADDAVLAAIATVQADTDNIQTRLPAALVSGKMDSSVGAMAADVITAAALAADAANEIADVVLSRNASSVEATAPEHSLCTMVLAGLESSIFGSVWTIRRTTGATHAIKAVTVTPGADPITGVT